jgi:signal transduction histidine kinase
MTTTAVVLAAGETLAARLAPALEASGISLTRLDPEEARPDILRTLGTRLLILEARASLPLEALQAYWSDLPMDEHLAVLLVEPPGTPAFLLQEVDEPVDRVTAPAEPGEVVARTQGLLRERTLRIFRRCFHDMSQPLTIARAFAQRAMKLVAPGDPVHSSLEELDRQVARMFRIAEDLQRRRME